MDPKEDENEGQLQEDVLEAPSAKRPKLTIVERLCEVYGIKAEYLNEENFDQLPKLGPQQVTNGLVLELYAYCNVHKIQLGTLYLWIQKLVGNNVVTQQCSKLSFMCRIRRLKKRRDKMRSVPSKEGEHKILLESIFKFDLGSSSEINGEQLHLEHRPSESFERSLMEKDIEKLISSSEKLKLENDSLKRENEEKMLLLITAENEVVEAKKAFDEKSDEAAKHRKDKITTLKRFAGLKRAERSLKRKREQEKENVPPRQKETECQTNIAGVDRDLIEILNPTKSKFVDVGRTHYGCNNNAQSPTKKASADAKCYVSRIPIRKVPTESAVRSEKVKRANQGMDILKYVAAREGEIREDEDILPLLTTWFRQYPELMQRAASAAGLQILEKLSPEETADLRACGRLSNSEMRMMRTFLNKKGCNIYASERKVRNVETLRTEPVSAENVEVGMIALNQSASDEELKQQPFAKVKDLRKYLTDIIVNAEEEGKLSHDAEFGGKYYLLFQSDRGSTVTKFYVLIVNEVEVRGQTVDSVHVYCCYEGLDSSENMWKVYLPFLQQLKSLSKPGVKINGREFEMFLGGDFKNIDMHLGKQGSTSTYPDENDLVTLKHLQKHDQTPHTIDSCPFELRTISHYVQEYNEYLADDRADAGKHHSNVVNDMLCPIKSIDHIAPPILHVVMGVVEKLYQILVKECEVLDGENDVDEGDVESNDEIQEELLNVQETARETKSILEDYGNEIIEIHNRKARHEAMMNGDTKENENLARLSSTNKTIAVNEQCKTARCIVTNYDFNVEWLQCDRCDAWCHSVCEGLTVTEERSLAETSDEFECNQCKGADINAIPEVLSAKIDVLVIEQSSCKETLVEIEIEENRLSDTINKRRGAHVTKLETALESIGVERGTYHGGSFNGNMATKLLQNFAILLEAVVEHDEIRHKFEIIFSILSRLLPLVYTTRFLSPEEINEVCKICEEFGEAYPMLFHGETITRKMHCITHKIPRFVKKWKSVGLFAEQAGESVHNAFNQEGRTLACVKKKKFKLMLLMQAQERRCRADMTSSWKEERICFECRPAKIFKKNVNGTLVCPNCST